MNRIKKLLILVCVLFAYSADAWAVDCPALGGCGNQYADPENQEGATFCSSYTPGVYCTTYNGREYGIYTCSPPWNVNSYQCPNGYKAVLKTSNRIGCTYTYVDCDIDSSCSDWETYEAYTYRDCHTNEGRYWTEVKCSTNAYGLPPASELYEEEDFEGCTMCPENATCDGSETFICHAGTYKNAAGTACTACPSFYGQNQHSQVDSTSITQCYVNAGDIFNDGRGNWKFTQSCYYNN